MTNTVTAVKIDVNGQATIVELQADGQGVGKAFREALDCRNFDVVRLAPGLDMWIDDEGCSRTIRKSTASRPALPGPTASAGSLMWERWCSPPVTRKAKPTASRRIRSPRW